MNVPLLTGDAHPIWDGDAAYAPWQMLVGDAARDGRLLGWNPWSNAGSPDGFDPQFGARSPLHLAVGLVFGGTLAGYYAVWLLVWWLSGVGVLLLCRRLGAGPRAATVAALAFAFSGFQLCHGQHLSFVVVYASMPFVVWRLDAGLAEARLRPVAESAAIFGLASLGGYPGVSVVSALFLALWALGRLVLGPGEGGPPLAAARRPAWLALAAVLWGAVAGVAAAPTTLGLAWEARGFSDRSEPVSFERAVETNAMVPAALMSTFGPAVASMKAAERERWPETDTSSMSHYPGVVAVWLALCGVALGRRRALTGWLLVVGLLGLGFALGTTLPLRGWLYELFPPSRYFRHASIFRAWLELAVAVASVFGWRALALERAGAAAGARRFVPLALAVGLALAAAGQLALVREPLPHAPLWLAHGVLTGSAVIAVAAALAFRPRGGTRGLGRPGLALVAIAAVDLGATAWLQQPLRMDAREKAAESWRTVAETRRHGFDLVALDTPREFTSGLFPLNTNKNLLQRIPTFRNYSPLLNRFQRAMANSLQEIPWVIGEERMWFVPRAGAGFVALSDANYDGMIARSRNARRRFVPLHTPSAMLDPAPPGAPGPRPAADAETLLALAPAVPLAHRILAYEPERLVLEVTAPVDGFAVVTDRWARGWEARVDGEPALMLGAAFVFRAVAVPAGTHVIEMVYAPRTHPGLLAASWGVLAAVGAASLAGAVRRRRAD